MNEPRTLAVVVPVLLLIPGVRDVILHVAGDLVTGVFRARRFMAEPRRWQPPPPPEVRRGQRGCTKHGAGPAPQPPVMRTLADPWAPSALQAPYDDDFGGAPPAYYSEAAAAYVDASESLGAEEEEAPPAGRRAAAPRAARPRAAASRARYEPRGEEPAGAGQEGVGPPPRRPPVYYDASSGPRQAAPPDTRDRIVRPSAQGRVGVDVKRQKPSSLLWQPLLAVFPFLRFWGGFF